MIFIFSFNKVLPLLGCLEKHKLLFFSSLTCLRVIFISKRPKHTQSNSHNHVTNGSEHIELNRMRDSMFVEPFRESFVVLLWTFSWKRREKSLECVLSKEVIYRNVDLLAKAPIIHLQIMFAYLLRPFSPSRNIRLNSFWMTALLKRKSLR